MGLEKYCQLVEVGVLPTWRAARSISQSVPFTPDAKCCDDAREG